MYKVIAVVLLVILLAGTGLVFANNCSTGGSCSIGEEKTEKMAKAGVCPIAGQSLQSVVTTGVVGNTMLCPVMGGELQISEKTPYSEYKGKIYYFCCPDCKPNFEKNPEKYIAKIKAEK